MCPPTSQPVVPPDAINAARASFRRCCQARDFFVCFYRHFFRVCPDAEPLFAHTDFKRQYKLLQHAIGLLLNYPRQQADDPNILRRVAERHSRRDLGIAPSMYGPFVDALMETVREHDAECDAATEEAWRRTLAPGVAYMQGRY
jgi:hemoglobin-like flavoprotein